MWVGTRRRLWASSVILPQSTPARLCPRSGRSHGACLVGRVPGFFVADEGTVFPWWCLRAIRHCTCIRRYMARLHTYMHTHIQALAGGKGVEWTTHLMKGEEQMSMTLPDIASS